MANKKYFWIKLRPDFFNDPYIKLLRRMAGGDTYTIIYLEMLIKSASTNGMIYFQGAGEDIAEELALMLDENVEDVRALLAYLEAKKLITHPEIKQDLFLVASADMTGSEVDSAKRVREFRQRQKQKALQSNTEVTNGNDKLEIEKELEKDIDTPLTPRGEDEVVSVNPAKEMLDIFNNSMNRTLTNSGIFGQLVMKNISVQEFQDVMNYIVDNWTEDIISNFSSSTLVNKFDKYSDKASEFGYRDGKRPNNKSKGNQDLTKTYGDWDF
ncbi:phage replisome organizer N-terminal domain-containing protein [Fructobacillus tropaeoli]|uniref:Phage replisome organiser N-terminal domain-containing protein n=1 Tax=Fructobacillus tropaeoli TaxID=709323 RepID=A0A3F3H1Z4_9LACO|nr:phage replisome organizer N-terminal domain-containing protein [Fructobacillus tropaeoli]GAP05011.1 hypothetical protein FTRO_0200040 [Fructobacillus tropaeoli]